MIMNEPSLFIFLCKWQWIIYEMTIYLKYNTHLIGSNINVLDRFIVVNWEIRTISIKKKENPAKYYHIAIYIKLCVTIFFMLSNLLLNPSIPCLRRRTMKLSSNKWLQKVLYLRCGCKEIDPFLAVFVTDFFKLASFEKWQWILPLYKIDIFGLV